MFATSTGGRKINGGLGMLVCDGGVRDPLVALARSSSCFGGVVDGVGAELSLPLFLSFLMSFVASFLIV